MPDIARRNPLNPILRPADLQPSITGLKIECLLNPGIFRVGDKVGMLVRVAERPVQKDGHVSFPIIGEKGLPEIIELPAGAPGLDLSDPRIIRYNGSEYLTTLSHLRLLYADSNGAFKEPRERVVLHGAGSYETYGIEDCRVARLGSTYYLTYTAVSPHGVGVGLVSTTDWAGFSSRKMLLPPHNKDCALFEKKVNGKYYMLHRPSSVFVGGNYIWLAESPDLEHWGNHACIARTRDGKWDSQRVGAGASPILTDEGWLEIYHGADSSHRYCLGALLLDKDDPSRVIARSDEPVMEPLASYERTGFFGNVIFTNGHFAEGDLLRVYYGASDEVICSADFSIKEILQTLK
jgi:predicted GH43/DUF377 family glycosyl hydrolase